MTDRWYWCQRCDTTTRTQSMMHAVCRCPKRGPGWVEEGWTRVLVTCEVDVHVESGLPRQ